MRKGTTKSQGRKHALDKFYTKRNVAKYCIDSLSLDKYDLVIEPSAGNGAFFSQIDNCVGFDLAPELSGITKADWFDISYDKTTDGKILVVGNPPFGIQNNLAIQFINHAAKFATTIAFVLPLSFMKESIQSRIDKNFHLTHNEVLDSNSFELHGESVNVPCVFQVWEHNPHALRHHSVLPVIDRFSFVKKTANPDLYIQRIGGNAGKAGTDWQNRSINSNYFIQLDEGFPYTVEEFIAATNELDFPHRDLSVGPRSISKSELMSVLLEKLPKLTETR